MNKKRVIISAAIGTMALVALSVSLTLAWYGASDRMLVENLDVAVMSKGDLYVSTTSDIDSFKTDLTNEDINHLPDNFLFAPVSTMLKDNWMDKKADKPEFYDSANKQILSNGEPYLVKSDFGFFQSDIYLLTSIRNQYVTLDLDNCLFEANTDSNFARAQELYNKYHNVWNLQLSDIQEKLDNLVNCLRVSILVNQENSYDYYIIDPTKKSDEVTYLGGLLDNDKNGYYDTYKDFEGLTKEVIYGEVNNRDLIVYDDPVDPSFKEDNKALTSDEASDFLGNSFHGESKPSAYAYNKEKSEAAGFRIAEEQSLSLDDLRNNENSLLIPIESNVPIKIVVSIYLEGWDLDCINATMGASFNTKLSFKLKGGNI